MEAIKMSFRRKVVHSLLLTIIVSGTVWSLMSQWSSLRLFGDGHTCHSWAVHAFAILAVIVGGAWLTTRLGIPLSEQRSFWSLFSIPLLLLGMLMRIGVCLPGNYYAVDASYGMISYHESGESDVMEKFPMVPRVLYHHSEPAVEAAIGSEALEKGYFMMSSFVFWQTGYGYGYRPFRIEGAKGEGFFHMLGMILAVVPLFLLESYGVGMLLIGLPMLLFQALFYWYYKEMMWWA